MEKQESESYEAVRNQAIAAYKKFVEQGITNPDDLDLDDPEVQEAHELFYQWQAQEEARVQGNKEAEHEFNLAKTTFYVDAGFTDPEYLDEVLESLDQNLQDAEEDNDDESMAGIIEKIEAKIALISGLL